MRYRSHPFAMVGLQSGYEWGGGHRKWGGGAIFVVCIMLKELKLHLS